ncbi:hypothetical protein ACFQU2_00975 [Siccirubricoccus deserti]
MPDDLPEDPPVLRGHAAWVALATPPPGISVAREEEGWIRRSSSPWSAPPASAGR